MESTSQERIWQRKRYISLFSRMAESRIVCEALENGSCIIDKRRLTARRGKTTNPFNIDSLSAAG